MLLGQELFVLEIANKITTTKLVADAKEDPFIPQPEHVRTGDALVSFDPEFLFIKIRMKHLANVVPILQIIGLHDHGGFFFATPVHSKVDASVDPYFGFEVRHIGYELTVLVTRRHLMRLAPLVKVVVETIRNPFPLRSLPVINNRRTTVFGNKARSA